MAKQLFNHAGAVEKSEDHLAAGRGVWSEVEPGKGGRKDVVLMFVFLFASTQITN